MTYSEKSLSFLSRMGWFPDRKINTEEIVKTLKLDGYSVSTVVEKFISSFGLLEGEIPAYAVENEFDLIHFSPTIAMENIYRERVKAYEDKIKESLVVVGEAYSGHMVIMVSDKGSIYGGFDDFLCLIGTGIEQGINSIFSRGPFTEIQ